MQRIFDLFDAGGRLLNTGIAGSEFTPLKLIIVITLIAVLAWVTRRVTRWFVDKVLARRGFDISMREALGAIVRYGVITLGALVILQSAGIDLTSLNVLVGAIGVGLGFGLQNITNNFFSGLILLFERPIKIGHRVEIGGAVGEVREIAARATTIVTDENVAIVIPNSQFVSERVTNWSRPGQIDRLRPVVSCVALVGSGIGTARTARRCGRARRCADAIRLRRWSSSRPDRRPSGFGFRCGARST